MKLIAHRGLQTKNTKENTLIAMSLGNNHNKLAGIELDVRLTKDNQVVVIHDEYIDRVSDGHGKVCEMTLARLKNFNYGTEIKPSTINTLSEILNKLSSNNLIIIELKNEYEKNNILANKVLEIIKNYPNLRICLKSFSLDIVKLLKSKSNFPVGLLINKTHINNLNFDVDFYSISKDIITKEIVNEKISNNKFVMIWTVNTKEELNDLKNKLDVLINNIYIISDNPLKRYYK